ncbi:hypothetical protein RRG08_024908 [Elysia crispata]|uniref:Uncharacterized protein n=1 Tax=Elysia crispata TaxID=231223 RepID=A0AAE1DQG7_9GAST|nr:hypothetical protein RRG08_024908 [Elysia crispata]
MPSQLLTSVQSIAWSIYHFKLTNIDLRLVHRMLPSKLSLSQELALRVPVQMPRLECHVKGYSSPIPTD